MMTLRTEDGALKCAFLDFLREEARPKGAQLDISPAPPRAREGKYQL